MRTPIMVAARYDNPEAIETLVKAGAKVDDKDNVSGNISIYYGMFC